jgi:Holliday junction resolvasome RuvABC endonuclease subunit
MKNLISRPNSFCTIDASTNSLAFAYFVNDELIKHGKIKYQGNEIYEKIVDAAHKTKSFFDQFDSLNHIVIEQPIYLNSPKTAANLAMSHGAIVAAAALTGIDHMASVVPMVWQNWSGNKRLTNEEKKEIRQRTLGKSESWYKSQERLIRKQRTIKFVNNMFDLHVDDDDVADAIAIGAWAIDNWKKVF